MGKRWVKVLKWPSAQVILCSYSQDFMLSKSKGSNITESVQPCIVPQPLWLIDMSKGLSLWCEAHSLFLSRVWADLYGNGLTSLLERLLRVCWFSVQVCPTLPCHSAWLLPWEKLLCSNDVMAMFWAIVSDIFYLCACPARPSQVRAPVKGFPVVIYPRAFTQPLAILSNTWMERRSLGSCLWNQLPKRDVLGKHYLLPQFVKPLHNILFCSQIWRPTYFRSYQLNVPIKQWPCLF